MTRKRSLVERVDPLSIAVLLMIGAEFPHFAPILAHYWHLLPGAVTNGLGYLLWYWVNNLPFALVFPN